MWMAFTFSSYNVLGLGCENLWALTVTSGWIARSYGYRSRHERSWDLVPSAPTLSAPSPFSQNLPPVCVSSHLCWPTLLPPSGSAGWFLQVKIQNCQSPAQWTGIISCCPRSGYLQENRSEKSTRGQVSEPSPGTFRGTSKVKGVTYREFIKNEFEQSADLRMECKSMEQGSGDWSQPDPFL